MFGEIPTLAIAALDEEENRYLVCLDSGQTSQGGLSAPVFEATGSSGSRSVVCMGMDYAFSPGDLAHARAYQDDKDSLNGALLVGASASFLRVHGRIQGSYETRYLDIATGTLLALPPESQATFSVPAWSIRWTDAEVSRHFPDPLFSFPAAT